MNFLSSILVDFTPFFFTLNQYGLDTGHFPSYPIHCYKRHRKLHDGETLGVNSIMVYHDLSVQTGKSTNLGLVPQQSHDSSPISYSNLLSSRHLHRLLLRYPRLRAQIKLVYKATLEPSQRLSPANCNHHDRSQGGGDFDRRRGRGRARGGARARAQNEPSSAEWTQERGLKQAVRLLKDIRGRDDEVGTSMEEFSRLVIKMREDTLSVGVSITHKVRCDTTNKKTRIEPEP